MKRAVFNATDPPLVVDIADIHTASGAVLILTVPQSPALHATTSGKYLRRVGRTCQPVAPYQIPTVLVQKGQLDYSAMVAPGASLDDLDPLEVRMLRAVITQRNPRSELAAMNDRDFLVSLELARREGGALLPTVAGLLLAGKAAALNAFIPGARVTYLHFGADEIDYDFREDLQRPLVSTLERLTELIEARNLLHTLPVGLARVEIRLEVESPGGFPSGITPETILHHRPKHRNPVLARILQRLGYVEQAGIGVDRIYRALLMNGKEPPQYVEQGDSVRLVLRDGLFDKGYALFAAEAVARGKPLTLDQLIVLSHLKRQRSIDRATAAAVCQRSERETGEILAGDEAAYMRDRGLDAVRWREMVLEYARTWGSVTNEKCRDMCGLNFHQATRLLAGLCRKGLLRREGRGRYTRYVPVPPE